MATATVRGRYHWLATLFLAPELRTHNPVHQGTCLHGHMDVLEFLEVLEDLLGEMIPRHTVDAEFYPRNITN